MNTKIRWLIYPLLLLSLHYSLLSCNEKVEVEKIDQPAPTVDNSAENQEAFVALMQQHLDAVSNRDLAGLKATMAPNGKMQLILPKTEIIQGVDKFMEYHQEWFKDSLWTFETKILNTEVGDKFGMAITEVIYREPDRNGAPYFNKMIVSYDLEKIEGKWCVIKDHASSIEKSTDKKQ